MTTSAVADGQRFLRVDGLLLDFKSARRPLAEMSQRTAWQLTGYLLFDAADRYRIDTVSLYLPRSGVLASWPVDDFLTLLGTCRRDLTELRGVFGELLAGCRGRRPVLRHGGREWSRPQRPGVHSASARVHPPVPEVHTTWCQDRDKILRRRGLMPGGPRPLLPVPRKPLLDLPDDADIVNLTRRLPR